MTEEDIKNLSKKELQDIIFKVQKLLSDKQKKEFQKIVKRLEYSLGIRNHRQR